VLDLLKQRIFFVIFAFLKKFSKAIKMFGKKPKKASLMCSLRSYPSYPSPYKDLSGKKDADKKPDYFSKMCFQIEQLLHQDFGDNKQSCHYNLNGRVIHTCHIGYVNGMNTTKDRFIETMLLIQKAADGHLIEGVYNQTHGPFHDLCEVFFINMQGLSSPPEKLILENWKSFLEKTKEDDSARYLQIYHSQAAYFIHNLKDKLSPEERKKICLLGFAPPIINSKNDWGESFSYASIQDPVPNVEKIYKAIRTFFSASSDSDDSASFISSLEDAKTSFENAKELIWLDKHPEETELGHGMDNPAFYPILEKHLKQYLRNYS